MKIYTGRGDFGNTNIIGGATVKKTDILVKAYGSVDELNSSIGLLMAKIENEYKNAPAHKSRLELIRKEITLIQHTLFDLGSNIADRDGKREVKVRESSIEALEDSIDFYYSKLPKIKYFVLPGGSLLGSEAHLVRTLVRKTEIAVLEVVDVDPVDTVNLVYLNRLSDYFYALARYLNMMDKKEEVFYKGTGEVFH